jgi:hypothetical protein
LNNIYITGADCNYFFSAVILLQAFKEYCRNRKLWICDFGLNKEQQRLLTHAGCLIQKPDMLQDRLHPWIYKSSIIHYLKNMSFDSVVWLDSDAFIVGPFADRAESIISKFSLYKDSVAICRGKKGTHWDVASPKENIKYFNMPSGYPYFNSGIWILRSQKVLEEWAKHIIAVPKKGMFEQDAFNYLLYKYNVEICLLKNDIWNVTHDSLKKLQMNKDGSFSLNNEQVLIIHLTGKFDLLKISIGLYNGFIRTIDNQHVKEKQIQLLQKWMSAF